MLLGRERIGQWSTVEDIDAKAVKEQDREALISAYHAASTQRRRDLNQLRSFRNLVREEWGFATENRPIDAMVMAVVDSWDLGGANVYEKWAE